MPYPQEIIDFAQDVRLVTHNRRFDEIEEEDGQEYVSQIVSNTNMLLGELETLVDPVGDPVYWSWMRRRNYELGFADMDEMSVKLPSSVQALITDISETISVMQDDTLVSTWSVVAPSQIADPFNRRDNRVAVIDGYLEFSRNFNEAESDGTIVGDVVISIPRLSETNSQALSLVRPRELLTLGVAKNVTLPDIVQGPLSPSYVQKYQDLLNQAIMRNRLTSRTDEMGRQDFSYVRGIY